MLYYKIQSRFEVNNYCSLIYLHLLRITKSWMEFDIKIPILSTQLYLLIL